VSPFLLATATLWQRELVRFFRQRSRVVGALGPPVLFWFLIGSGLGKSFQLAPLAGGAGAVSPNYMQYFFPGTIILIVLFTAIFSTISIIEDRHEGFLQSVWVAPVPRGALVLGKIAGGTTLAFLQGAIFLCFCPLVGISVRLGAIPYLLLILLVISFGLTGLGFMLAWRLDSTQGFHAIMNLLLIPMWLLSGALFPLQTAPAWLRGVMRLNPLSYGLSALGETFRVNGHALQSGFTSPAHALAVITIFSAITYILSVVSTLKS
jgi:ABC-2 type transport system permease protein